MFYDKATHETGALLNWLTDKSEVHPDLWHMYLEQLPARDENVYRRNPESRLKPNPIFWIACRTLQTLKSGTP